MFNNISLSWPPKPLYHWNERASCTEINMEEDEWVVSDRVPGKVELVPVTG